MKTGWNLLIERAENENFNVDLTIVPSSEALFQQSISVCLPSLDFDLTSLVGELIPY